MSLRLNVNVSKKVGQPDYGSIGAACGIELDLSESLLFDDLEAFQSRVRDAYVACNQAIDDELSRLQARAPPPIDAPQAPANGHDVHAAREDDPMHRNGP